MASILRRSKLPVILVANKTDNNNLRYDAAEFYKLGLGDPMCISAATGSDTGDLLDMVLEKLPLMMIRMWRRIYHVLPLSVALECRQE